jgi:hypothetical protein
VIDLQGLLSLDREQETRLLADIQCQHPCDLATGPLLRIFLLRLGIQEHVLLLTLHHIITDGWSNQVFIRELTTLYRAYLSGQPSPLPPYRSSMPTMRSGNESGSKARPWIRNWPTGASNWQVCPRFPYLLIIHVQRSRRTKEP